VGEKRQRIDGHRWGASLPLAEGKRQRLRERFQRRGFVRRKKIKEKKTNGEEKKTKT